MGREQWTGRAAHPGRRGGGRRCWRVLVGRWRSWRRALGRRGRARSTPTRSRRARRRRTCWAPTRSAATSSAACWSRRGVARARAAGDRDRRRRRARCWARCRRCSARRAGRLVTAAVNIAVAFPGLLLALFFAVIFGVGARGAVLAIGLAGAPSFARLAQTLAAGVAGRDYVAAARVAGVGRFRLLAPARAAEHRRAAGGQRDDRGRRRAARPSPGCPSSGSACSRRPTTGAGCSARGWTASTSTRPPRWRPASPSSSPASRSTCSARRSRRCVGVRTARRRQPPAAPASAAAAEAATRGRGRGGARRRGPAGRLPGARRRLDHPGARREPHRPPRRGGRHRRRVRLGQEPHRAGGRPARRGHRARSPRTGWSSPARDRCGRPDAQARELLGTSLAMVFQDPMTSFNPSMRIGRQLAEVAEVHQGMGRRAALARAVDRLRAVRVPAPERRAHQYPHEFSGGMRQRAMIGMGLMGTPALIIADEPTTALDVTVQRQVLRLLERRPGRRPARRSLLISHDIAVVAQLCDRVLVMYAGRMVEDLPVDRARRRGARTRTPGRCWPRSPTWPPTATRPLAVIPGRPAGPGDRSRRAARSRRACPFADDRCRGRGPGAGRRRPRDSGSPAGTRTLTRPPDRRSTRVGGCRMSELRFEGVAVRFGTGAAAHRRRRRRPHRARRARSSGWSASPARASRRWPGGGRARRRRPAGGSCSTARPLPDRAAAGAGCRWSSRTRTPRWTRG